MPRLAEPDVSKQPTDRGMRAVVVGGGIAGIAAATVFSERGVKTTLLEQADFLGGRAGAWPDRLASGEPFQMERGFHAFFRQYYNLRSLLRRVDPDLAFLEPMNDYPILGPKGTVQSFCDLPRRAPMNIIKLTARTPTLGLRDLMRVNARRALEMLAFDARRTYERWDGVSAKDYLDSLRFPPDARRLLFDVFSHSFFNPESDMSAGELLMMFHFYFTGNPEGLIFDVANAPFSTCIWEPMARYLTDSGAVVRAGESVRSVDRSDDGQWIVESTNGRFATDLVVLAVTVPALQEIAGRSPALANAEWLSAVSGLGLTNPFIVWRLWLDRPTRPDRSPFVGTTGVGPLDNISLYHALEDESRSWAQRSGGAVVELHAYAVERDFDELKIRSELLKGLNQFYPETRGARILEERFRVDEDCPAFEPGSHAKRPGVATPFEGVALAGDFVRLPLPTALMERAATSGFMAANQLLDGTGIGPEPVESISQRGLLAALPI